MQGGCALSRFRAYNSKGRKTVAPAIFHGLSLQPDLQAMAEGGGRRRGADQQGTSEQAWVTAMSIMAGSWFGAELARARVHDIAVLVNPRLPVKVVSTRRHIYISLATPNTDLSSTA
jgi:hypothetical protein